LKASQRGRVQRLSITSEALAGNWLGDPHERAIPVYLPPGYDEGRGDYPVLYCLAGFTGTGESHLAWKGWAESLPERLDRLLAHDEIGPMLVVLPDCWTRLGGSQYINSATCGRYDDYLGEVIAAVDGSLRTKASARHRGVFGKSSGGFGAMVQSMLHPERWGAAACHSGDAFFEFCFWNELPKTLNVVNRAGGVAPFLQGFARKRKRSNAEVHAMMLLAMAACFDPQPEHPDGFELPVDLLTGEVRPERWARWLAWDPVRMIPNSIDVLAGLRALHIDCGDRDQYHLHYGARQMRNALVRGGVGHTYEEFPDNHSSIGYRMDVSLPILWKAVR